MNQPNKIQKKEYRLTFVSFIESNWIYMFFIAFYFALSCWIIGFNLYTLLFLILAYSISMLIAVSEIGEKLLRLLNNVRQLETKREKEYLLPIYDEVYRKVEKLYPQFDNVEICVIDAMYINACALGRRTIAVTRGAMNTLSEDELKGLIAHEFGHIVHGHTIASLLTTIGNGIFTILVVLMKLLISLMEFTISMFGGKGIVNVLASFIKGILELLVFVVVYIGELILSVNSREQEYEADLFAFRLRYGKQLIESLYLLHEMTISGKKGLVEKLKASHPHIAKRIGRLETYVDYMEKRMKEKQSQT